MTDTLNPTVMAYHDAIETLRSEITALLSALEESASLGAPAVANQAIHNRLPALCTAVETATTGLTDLLAAVDRAVPDNECSGPTAQTGSDTFDRDPTSDCSGRAHPESGTALLNAALRRDPPAPDVAVESHLQRLSDTATSTFAEAPTPAWQLSEIVYDLLDAVEIHHRISLAAVRTLYKQSVPSVLASIEATPTDDGEVNADDHRRN